MDHMRSAAHQTRGHPHVCGHIADVFWCSGTLTAFCTALHCALHWGRRFLGEGVEERVMQSPVVQGLYRSWYLEPVRRGRAIRFARDLRAIGIACGLGGGDRIHFGCGGSYLWWCPQLPYYFMAAAARSRRYLMTPSALLFGDSNLLALMLRSHGCG